MQDLNLKSAEVAILSWMRNYSKNNHPNSIKDLSDGIIFLRILSEIPTFKMTQPIETSEQNSSKLHIRIKNMRIIYDSLKLYYQHQLQKDTSRFNISLGELSTGGAKDLVKFVEFIIGAIMWSEKKKQFLEMILLLSEEHQETFMGLIKNAMNYSEDTEICNTNNKARNLLQRIDELEDENIAMIRTIQEMKTEAKEKQSMILSLKEQAQMLRRQNRNLVEQMQIRQTPEKSSRESSRLQYKILQRKISVQQSSYQTKIKQLEGYLLKCEEKIQQYTTSEYKIKQFEQEIRVLSKDLEINKFQLLKSLNMLKDKDNLLLKLRTKNEQYESRILKLEGDLEEQILKTSMISQSKDYQDAFEPLKSHRVVTSLREQMNNIAQQLTIQNSRLISQKISKQQQYQQIILSQREQIRKLKQSVHEKIKENKSELLSILRKQNVQTSNIDIGKLMSETTNGHHQQLMILIQMLTQKTQEVKKLQEGIRKQKETKQNKRRILVEKANQIKI